MRVLVTGFGPFLDHGDNPSEALAHSMDGLHVGNAEFVTFAPLPVVFGEGAQVAERAREDREADAILSIGLAAPAERIRVERVGRNCVTSNNPDAVGASPRGPIHPDAPETIETLLDVDAVVRTLLAASVEAEPSESAGGYVCNDLYFRLLAKAGARRPVLFVHIPPRADERPEVPQALAEAFVAGCAALPRFP